MAVVVRRIHTDEDLLVAFETDHVAFSLGPDRSHFDRTLPVRRTMSWYLATRDGATAGTAGVHHTSMTVPGGASVPISAIADVGVLPGHRRQGVLGALMERVLDDATDAGHVAAVLYSSEARIYGRFGFGPVTRTKRYRLPTARARLRGDVAVAAGECRPLAPAERREVLPKVFEAARWRRPGEIDRSPENWDVVLGVPSGQSEDRRLCLVHRPPGGPPDGYVLYTVDQRWDPTGPHHVARVSELVAVDTAVELALWEALCGLDLVETVEGYTPADSVLYDALEDRWAVETTGEHDGSWVRVLDVGAALAARRYRAPGALALEVLDRVRPGVGGCFSLRVGADGTCELESRPVGQDGVELRLGVDAFASVWMGGASVGRLAAVGRAEEVVRSAAARADALLGWYPSPGLVHEF